MNSLIYFQRASSTTLQRASSTTPVVPSRSSFEENVSRVSGIFSSTPKPKNGESGLKSLVGRALISIRDNLPRVYAMIERVFRSVFPEFFASLSETVESDCPISMQTGVVAYEQVQDAPIAQGSSAVVIAEQKQATPHFLLSAGTGFVLSLGTGSGVARVQARAFRLIWESQEKPVAEPKTSFGAKKALMYGVVAGVLGTIVYKLIKFNSAEVEGQLSKILSPANLKIVTDFAKGLDGKVIEGSEASIALGKVLLEKITLGTEELCSLLNAYKPLVTEYLKGALGRVPTPAQMGAFMQSALGLFQKGSEALLKGLFSAVQSTLSLAKDRLGTALNPSVIKLYAGLAQASVSMAITAAADSFWVGVKKGLASA